MAWTSVDAVSHNSHYSFNHVQRFHVRQSSLPFPPHGLESDVWIRDNIPNTARLSIMSGQWSRSTAHVVTSLAVVHFGACRRMRNH